MRIPRLYIQQPLSSGADITISGQTAHHVSRVLRLQAGAGVKVFNGDGHDFDAVLMEAGRTRIRLQIGACLPSVSESTLNITLAQGIARSDRMDLIVQKSVELGVSTIQPLWMQRCQGHSSTERMEKRIKHWQGIITAACEQCGRSRIPALDAPASYGNWISRQDTDALRLMLQPGSTDILRDFEPVHGNIIILVGPEGGMSQDEQLLATHAGFKGIRLGQRILRTETAALTALAATHALWGDFSGA